MTLLVPPPVVMLLTAFGMWLSSRIAPGLAFAFPGQRALALGIALGGLALMLAAVAALWSARTTVNPFHPERSTQLVTDGVFRLSRNPIYLGDGLWLLAWAVWLGHPLVVPWLLVFPLYITHFQIEPEEAILGQRFGARYEAYRARVRRWI